VNGGDFLPSVPWGRGVAVLECDRQGVIALAKPEGLLSHPNSPRDLRRSLVQAEYAPEDECYRWTGPAGEPGRLWLLNRLDSATSGVILAAGSEDLAREIRSQFRRKQVTKVYMALVFGVPNPPTAVWRDVVAVDRKGGKLRTAAGQGRIPAESRMSLIRAGAGEPRLALLRLEPRTGRSHQLRVQCAKRGRPIVGDQTYGDFPRNREFARRTGCKRLFLHSLETAFAYEFQGRAHTFAARAPLPPEFEQLLGLEPA
jgi:23S rRNA-/tRNA-specific pseudouridylate synthase